MDHQKSAQSPGKFYWNKFLEQTEINIHTRKQYKNFKKSAIFAFCVGAPVGSIGLTLLMMDQIKVTLSCLLDEHNTQYHDTTFAVAACIACIAYPIFSYRLLRSYRMMLAMINNGLLFCCAIADPKCLDKEDERVIPSVSFSFFLAFSACVIAGFLIAVLTLKALNNFHAENNDALQTLYTIVAVCAGFMQSLNWLSAWALFLKKTPWNERFSLKKSHHWGMMLVLTLAIPSFSLAIERGEQGDEVFGTGYVMLCIMLLAQAASIVRGWGFLLSFIQGQVNMDYKNYRYTCLTSAFFYSIGVFFSSLLASHLLIFDLSIEELMGGEGERVTHRLFIFENIKSGVSSVGQCLCASTGALSALGNRLKSLEAVSPSAKQNNRLTVDSPIKA